MRTICRPWGCVRKRHARNETAARCPRWRRSLKKLALTSYAHELCERGGDLVKAGPAGGLDEHYVCAGCGVLPDGVVFGPCTNYSTSPPPTNRPIAKLLSLFRERRTDRSMRSDEPRRCMTMSAAVSHGFDAGRSGHVSCRDEPHPRLRKLEGRAFIIANDAHRTSTHLCPADRVHSADGVLLHSALASAQPRIPADSADAPCALVSRRFLDWEPGLASRPGNQDCLMATGRSTDRLTHGSPALFTGRLTANRQMGNV